MPLDLGDNPPRRGPGCGLIAEIGMEPPDFIGRSSDRTLEQVANPTLQDLVGRQSDRILDPLRTLPRCRCTTGSSTSFQPSALWTLPGRSAQRSRSPN